jgi:flagellar hook-basal body complex protein FliE
MNNNINMVLNQMRSIEALASNKPMQEVTPGTDGAGSFADMMQKAIDQVNDGQMKAAELGRALERGDPNVDLAEVMIAMQKSSVSFQALTEVRNKLLTAYQDVMNMPV